MNNVVKAKYFFFFLFSAANILMTIGNNTNLDMFNCSDNGEMTTTHELLTINFKLIFFEILFY